MKRITALLLAVITVICLFAACGKKDTPEDTKEVTEYAEEDIKKEDGYSYVILEDGTAKIIGFEAAEMINKIEMPSTFGDINVTSIGKSAFENCDKLHYVTLPKYITDIEEKAFAGSSIHVALMTSSRKLMTIHKDAFAGCDDLIQVDVSSSCEKIEAGAFANCAKLKVFTLRGNNVPDEGAITETAPGFKVWTYEDNTAVADYAKANSYEIAYLKRG